MQKQKITITELVALDDADDFAEESSVSKKGGRKIWRSIFWLVLLGSIVTGGFFTYNYLTATPKRDRKVKSVLVKRESLNVTVTANGTIQPDKSINVSPKNSGRLKTLLVKEGEQVQEGQILANMDDSNLQGQLMQAQGQVAAAEAILQKLQAGNRSQEIAQAAANLNSAQANLRQAESNFKQNQDLFSSGAIASRDFETSRTTRDSAQAQVRQAQQALSLQQSGARPEDIAQAQAQLTSAKGALEVIQSQINDAVIRAPFSGVVARKYADPGAFVSPSTSGSAVSSSTSSSILALASTNQVVANVAEANIAQIAIDQSVKIQADAYSGQSFKGKVISISPQSSVQQNVTSFEVKIAILDDPKQQLRSGMNSSVEFQVGKIANTLVVPTVAITRQTTGTGVFVAGKDGEAPVFTQIKTGLTIDDKTEVKSGLQGGEKVLISFPSGTRPQSSIPGVPSLGGSSRPSRN